MVNINIGSFWYFGGGFMCFVIILRVIRKYMERGFGCYSFNIRGVNCGVKISYKVRLCLFIMLWKKKDFLGW